MDWAKFRRIEDDQDLTAAEKYLMVCLLDLQDGDQAAYPSLDDLSRKTGMTNTSISRITGRLQKERKLVKKRRRGSSLYIVYPTPEEWQKFAPEFAQEQDRVRAGTTQSCSDAKTEFASRETDPISDPITDPTTSTATPQAAADKPPTPVNFSGWLDRLRDTPKNRVAVLAAAFSALYPDLGPPDYAMIGRTAKNMKHGSSLLELLWSTAPSYPRTVVDCKALMIYLQKIHRNQKRHYPKETPTQQPPKQADDSFRQQLKNRKEQRATDSPNHPPSSPARTAAQNRR